MMEKEVMKVGVVMRRTPLNNRWQSCKWQPVEIVSGDVMPQDGDAHKLRDDPDDVRWLFTGFDIRLYTDESEGYFLNISSPAPCWFIMWRMEERDGEEIAMAKTVTLSYNEAARLMDGGEQVDTLPASADTIRLLAEFVSTYYKPEPKRKRKKPSFEGGAGVAEMARSQGDTDGS
jgi:hypothetical protein